MSRGDARTVRAFAPATVSNLACGFDVLGFALAAPGDEVTVRRRGRPGLVLEVEGDGGRLPRDPARNTAGVAVAALLAACGRDDGLALTLHKHLPLSSGLGSSAASGVAALVAAARLLALEVDMPTLLGCALEAEAAACGSAHADNAAPSLHGGLVLIRPGPPPEVVPLPVPAGLSCALVRPHVEIETRGARTLLGDSVPLRDAVTQWANLGALVAGLHRGDLDLVSRSLVDVVAEPKRGPGVPGFAAAQRAARDAGALGASLSGSGPSIFALCRHRGDAERVADAMLAAVHRDTGLDADRVVSPVGARGARVIAVDGRRRG